MEGSSSKVFVPHKQYAWVPAIVLSKSEAEVGPIICVDQGCVAHINKK